MSELNLSMTIEKNEAGDSFTLQDMKNLSYADLVQLFEEIKHWKVYGNHLHNLSYTELDRLFEKIKFWKVYGNFSGKATQRAKLRFTPEHARWVFGENWHDQQIGSFDVEGYYNLEFDFNQDPELVMNILKYGSGVKVVSPSSLKNIVKVELEKALKNYSS